MTYDVNYFIRKFSAIPEEKWFVGHYSNDEDTKRCALGHCGISKNDMRAIKNYNAEAAALQDIFDTNLHMAVSHINDGLTTYKQPTPRQRILAALRDVQRMQQRVVYVAVDKEVRAEVKELINVN